MVVGWRNVSAGAEGFLSFEAFSRGALAPSCAVVVSPFCADWSVGGVGAVITTGVDTLAGLGSADFGGEDPVTSLPVAGLMIGIGTLFLG